MSLLGLLTGSSPSPAADDLTLYPPPPAPTSYPWTPLTTLAPPPSPGYPTSMVHPTVVDTGYGGFNGFRYWLADTPYPPEPTEDPHVWCSNDRVTWIEPAPGTNPIQRGLDVDGADASSYNSDPEIGFDPTTGLLWLWWRWHPGGAPGQQTRLYAASSPDGATWTIHGWAPMDGMSPSITRHPSGVWYRYDMEPATRMQSDNPLGPWVNPTPLTLYGLGSFRHGDMYYHEQLGIWMGAGALYGDCWAWASTDGLSWQSSAPILKGGWMTGTYRPTLLASNLPGYMDVFAAVMGGPDDFNLAYTRIPTSWWTSLMTT